MIVRLADDRFQSFTRLLPALRLEIYPSQSKHRVSLGRIEFEHTFIGSRGFVGAVVVWLTYLPHWEITEDKASKLGVFSTIPAVRKPALNMITEAVGTSVLLLGVLAIPSVQNLNPNLGFARGVGPFLVGLLVFSIGLSLGGSTGYAINPARDFGPRLAHFLLPIRGKGDSDWGYAWVPIVGPILRKVVVARFTRDPGL